MLFQSLRHFLIGLLTLCCIVTSGTVAAYNVEADSIDNTVYLLLRNLNSNDSYDSVSVSNNAPGIVTNATANIIPASVAAAGSDLLTLNFTVPAGVTLGATGDLLITVSGTVSGQTVDVDVTVPLTVVSSVANAQGAVGSTLPAPDPGGIDTDGDGVTDALETAFGSDPSSAESQPGDPIVEENVPMLGLLAMLALGGLFISMSSPAARRNAGMMAVAAIILLPSGLIAGSATRIQLIAEIPVPPPLPQLLTTTASASSTGAAGGAALAVDGNINSRWESAHGTDPQSITLDMGATYTLFEVIIHWEAANAASYRIDGSLDGINWNTSLASFSGGVWDPGAGVRRTDTLSVAGSYRYVRMFGLTRPAGNVYGYSIWEMEVYGLPAADEDGDGVDDASDLCPGTPPGSAVDATGCIIVDSDGDGVPDAQDQCPGTLPSATVDGTGCVIIIPVNEVTTINDILTGGAGSSQPGFTLYVFDNDLGAPDTSTCNGGCATSWPPLLVHDGVASGVDDLGTIVRGDSTVQATHNGRPLYYYIGDSATGQTNGDGAGGVWHTVAYVQAYTPLFDNTTTLEPALQEDTPAALITHLADRARDRHAREAQFQIYDHYLSFYWEHRTAEIEIVDTVGKGGDTITFNVITEWPLIPNQEELRFFHLSAAAYANNGTLDPVPSLDVPGETRRHYTRSVNFNPLTGQPLQVGDRMEFELSQFLNGAPNGRDNYYGTAILYVVGQGVVPWEAGNAALNPSPMPAAGKLGGDTTLNYQYSDEPDNHFIQIPTNLSNINGQPFMLGRRVHHTDFGDGSHNEFAENADFTELSNTLGTNYINRSCVACHAKNGRALPPSVGQPLFQHVFKVGDATGAPDPQLGSVLQPQVTNGTAEGGVTLASWTEIAGLRTPNYSFTGNVPTNFSARIAPQLVGLGLLEAIDEADIELLVDEADSNSDGISGRLQLVTDAVTSETRIGRFGWKATQPTIKQQVAAALNTDVGVMTSVLPSPDCGSSQTNCGAAGSELSDQHLDELTAYISLLGVSARRDLADAAALQGEVLFGTVGCNSCHVETFQTSPYHPHAELRDQTIHPYTDLLLHDMGPGLASTLVEGNAAGNEWRTAPLWNIGLTNGVSDGEGYLHDGRARTLHEAIMWHGGEATASQQAYDNMTAGDQTALIKFLESL